MTAYDIQALLSDNLEDATTRRVLGDALEDAGRYLEAKLARALHLPIAAWADGTLMPELAAESPDANDLVGRGELIGIHLPGWVNCHWGRLPLGGCWVSEEGLDPYIGSDMTGGAYPDAGWFAAEAGLDLTEDEADELRRMIRRASALEAESEMELYWEGKTAALGGRTASGQYRACQVMAGGSRVWRFFPDDAEWLSGHAAGSYSGDYETELEALAAAEAWEAQQAAEEGAAHE